MRVCDPMLPRMAEEFGVDVASVAPVVTAYVLGYGAAQLIHGPLGERLGKMRLITLASLAAALASLMCSMVDDLPGLVAARALGGAIGAAIIPLGFAWLGDVLPAEQRQPMLARFASGSMLGVLFGQWLGGGMVDSLGWRMAFFALTAVFGIAGALLWRELRDARRDRQGPAQATTTPPAARSGTGGSIPARYLRILRGGDTRRLLAIVGIEGMLVFGPMAFVPASLHQRLGLALWAAGMLTSMFAVGGLVYVLNARRLLARLGERGLVRLGATGLFTGLIGVRFAPGWLLAGVACAAIGFGFFCMHNTLQAHGTQISPGQSGLGMALFALCLFLGQSVGVGLASAVIARYGYGAAFLASAPLLLMLGEVLRNHLRMRSAPIR